MDHPVKLPARVPGDVGGGEDGVGRVRTGVGVAAAAVLAARGRCRRRLLVEGEALHAGQRLQVLQRQGIGPGN